MNSTAENVLSQSVIEAAGVNNAAASAKPKPKPRMKWTMELHENFVRAVDELGGPDNAIPSAILRLMDVVGLTVAQVESHLQKFRQGKTARRLQLGNNTSSTADHSRPRRPKKKAKVHRERGSSSHPDSVPTDEPQQQERGFQPPASHGYDLHDVAVAESSTMHVAETLEPPVVLTADTVIQPLFPLPVVPDSGLADEHVSSSLSPNKAPEINQQEDNLSYWDNFQDDTGSSSSLFHYHRKGKVEEFPEFDESLWDL